MEDLEDLKTEFTRRLRDDFIRGRYDPDVVLKVYYGNEDENHVQVMDKALEMIREQGLIPLYLSSVFTDKNAITELEQYGLEFACVIPRTKEDLA